MSIKQTDQRRLEALARYKSVDALERELASIQAIIEDYQHRIEEARADGEQTAGLEEMLEVWKQEKEEVKKQLKLKRKSNSDDEDSNEDDEEKEDGDDEGDEEKKSKGRRRLVKPSLHKLLRRRKPRRRGTGRVTPDYMYRLLRTKNPFVSRSLKTKIPDSSACKHPGLGLGSKSLSRRSGEEESRERPDRIMEPSLTQGSEHWDKLEEELTKAQNRGDIGWEEGCFTPMDVQARLNTPIDGITPYDALLMRWEDRVEEHFPSEERNRWSYDDYWNRFLKWVDRMAYDEIEAIVREWAADQDVRNLKTSDNLGGPEFAFGNSGVNPTTGGDLSGPPLGPRQNPLRPKREPVNPYYQGLENPLKKDNPLKPNPREDGYR